MLLHIEFVAFVVTDSAEMASQHSRSDEHAFVRKGRDIPWNGRVEIELTLFHKLHQSNGGEGLRDAANAEFGARPRGDTLFEIGVTEAFGIDDFSVDRLGVIGCRKCKGS